MVRLLVQGQHFLFSTMTDKRSFRDNVVSVAISPNGMRVVFGTTDGTIVLWDVDRCQQVLEPIAAHEDTINSLWYAPHGGTFISASDDQTIRLWNASTGLSARDAFELHTSGVLVAGFLAETETETIVSLSKNNIVLVWQVPTSDLEQQFRVVLDSRSLAALSNDCKKLLAVSRKGVTIWDTISAEPLKTLPLETPMALSLGFSRDSSRAVLGLAECNLHIWDLDKDTLDSAPLEGHKEHSYYIVWSPDSRTIAAVTLDGTLRIWDVERRECILGPYKTRGPFAYSPNSDFIVSPGEDGSLAICDVPMLLHNSSSSFLDLPAAITPGDRGSEVHQTSRSLENWHYEQSSTGQPYALQQSRLEGSGRKGPLKANVAKKAWADMSRGFRMLSTRSSKVDTVAAAKYKNPVVIVSNERQRQRLHMETSAVSVASTRSRSLTPSPDRAGCCMCHKSTHL